MLIRAVIFDIYGTLLEVLPPPNDREQTWAQLLSKYGLTRSALSLAEFDLRCRARVSLSHDLDRQRGIQYPEVNWRQIAREALPELVSFSESKLDDFIYEHAQLAKTVRLMTGAPAVLRFLVEHEVLLGICSNCQAYSLRELTEALRPVGLSLALFDPALCFCSFQAGFSKPNLEVFPTLQRTLAPRGLAGEQILMVGDRLDNDILPARAVGWRAWQISTQRGMDDHCGDYGQLHHFLSQNLPKGALT